MIEEFIGLFCRKCFDKPLIVALRRMECCHVSSETPNDAEGSNDSSQAFPLCALRSLSFLPLLRLPLEPAIIQLSRMENLSLRESL
jgi:hypothetical protein